MQEDRRDSPPGRRARPGRYFFLLLASFLLLVIAPVITFGIIAHRAFSTTLIEEARGYSREILTFLGRELDNDLLAVETQLLDLDLMSSFRYLTGDGAKTEPEIIYQARLTQEELARISGQNDILHSTILYFPEIDRVLTDQTTSVLADYENARLVSAVASGTFSEGPILIAEPVDFTERARVYTVTRQRPFGSDRPRALIMANLDLSRVETRLDQFRVVPEAGLSVVMSTGEAIASTHRHELPATGDTPHGSESDGRDVLFDVPSTLREWTYRTTIPADYFRTRTRPVRLLVAQLAAILIGLGVAASYALSRRLYSPIRRVLSDIERGNPDAKRRNEFALIDEAVRGMADSNRYLSRLLDVHGQSIQNAVFRRLLDGAYIQPDVLQASLSFLGFPEEWLSAAVLIIETDQVTMGEPSAESRFFQRLGIADTAKRLAESAGYSVFPLLLQRARVHLVLVMNKRDLADVRSLRTFAESMQRTVLTELGLVVSIGLGSLENRLHLLSHSAELASRAIQTKFVHGGASVFIADDAAAAVDLIYPYPVNEIQKINHHLTAGATPDLQESIRVMFADLVSHQALPPSLIKSVAIQLVSATAASLRERGLSMDQFLPDGASLLERIDQMRSIDELQVWIVSLYASIAERIREQADEYSAVVRGVIEFVSEHYAEPISLSHIADHLGMTQQYVSKRFKEEMGVNYVDYLNRFRLDAARDILASSRETIRAIGERVGFANPQYFIKRFRERFELTPAQYRESLVNGLPKENP